MVVSIWLNLELEVVFLSLLFGVARVHACLNSLTARLNTADFKMRLTRNHSFIFSFVAGLTN